MDFAFTEQEQVLRREIERFVENEVPRDWIGHGMEEQYSTDEGWAACQQVARKLAEKGWLTMSWPKEYGGRDATNVEAFLYRELMSYYRVPGADMGIGGTTWVAPSLMLFGTEQQKKERLPKIAAGEEFWCTGYSEPEAGSDMAAVRLRAVEREDCFVLNGQKIWTSAAHRAHWYWLAVRTDPDVAKHRGISLFIVDMKTPGITVNPLVNLAGLPAQCEVFFDDVRVPKENLLGELNRGWYHLMVAMDFERTSGIAFLGYAKRLIADLVDYARETKGDGDSARWRLIRSRLADLAIDCEVGRLICYRTAWMLDKGLMPNYEASMSKNWGAELSVRAAGFGMDLMGLFGQLEPGSRWARLQGQVEREYLCSVGGKIAAGTSEINRNIIAMRGLGLPRA